MFIFSDGIPVRTLFNSAVNFTKKDDSSSSDSDNEKEKKIVKNSKGETANRLNTLLQLMIEVCNRMITYIGIYVHFVYTHVFLVSVVDYTVIIRIINYQDTISLMERRLRILRWVKNKY